MKYFLPIAQSCSILLELVCLIFAVRFRIKNKTRTFLEYTYLYLSIAILMDTLWWWLDVKIANKFYLLYVLTEFSFFSIWFYKISISVYRYLIICSMSFVSLTILGMLVELIPLKLSYALLLFECIYVVSFSFGYFYSSFQLRRSFSLEDMQKFWALSGITICFVLSIPFYCLCKLPLFSDHSKLEF